MSELVADMEADWSLQAIVRGSSGEYSKIDDMIAMNMDDHCSIFESSAMYDHHDFLRCFPDIFDASTGSSDELEELYKPFYPATRHQSSTVQAEFQGERAVDEDNKPVHDHSSDQSSGTTTSVASVTAAYTPKYKKRKNQHKRVVIQVSAEGLSSDMWAWRKYGQKPIKGSPYPRSYYRCSSSKGCLARKQVEQSSSDPGKFIITYTAEHSHSKPTRRNSLAGTVRQKFPSPKSQNSRPIKQDKTDKSASTKAPQPDIVAPSTTIKQEETETPGDDHDKDSSMFMSDFVFNEDFFSGLEDFDEFIRDVPNTSAQQFPIRSCGWF